METGLVRAETNEEKRRYIQVRRKRCMEHREPRKREMAKRFIAVDIETDGLGGPFLQGAYQREGDASVHFFDSLDAWVEEIISKRSVNCIWYAHNGGEYDFKYLLQPLEDLVRRKRNLTFQVIRQGSEGRVIGFKLRYRNNVYELRDSFALINTSLAAMTSKFAPNLPKLDIGLTEGVTYNPADPVHRSYLERDVRGLLESLITFRSIMLAEFGIPLQWTIGSCAMRVFTLMLHEGEQYWRVNPKVEAFIRQCYYGGYVFLRTTNETPDCASVDVNSMYPSVMRDYGVPVGGAVHVFEEVPGRCAFYHVRAHVPDNERMTCVPMRTASGTVWPVGDFETHLSSRDMETARAMGASFEVIEGYMFREERSLFTEFVDRCERIRIEQKGTAMEAVVKLLQNSLYGKFGSKEESIEYLVASAIPEDKEKCYQPYIDQATGLPSDVLLTAPVKVEQPYMHIEWAAAITANARARLFQYIRAIGEEQVVYGDTDSITAHTDAIHAAIASGRLPVSNQYGDVKLEHEYVTFRAGGPKNYQGRTVDGAVIDKAKGIPRRSIRSDEHARALAGETVIVSFESMNSTISVLKDGKPIQAEKRTRTYSQLRNSQSWWVDTTGKVHPVRATITEKGGVVYGKS